jgi:hypothetical protein
VVVLRRLNKVQLLQALQRQTAAPFHVIIWDNSPVQLAEALQRLEHAPDDSMYYATPQRVFSTTAAIPAGR